MEYRIYLSIIGLGISLFSVYIFKIPLMICKKIYPIEMLEKEISIRASTEDFLYVSNDSPSTVTFKFIIINMSTHLSIIVTGITFNLNMKWNGGWETFGEHSIESNKVNVEVKPKVIKELLCTVELDGKYDAKLKEIKKSCRYLLKLSHVDVSFRTSLYPLVKKHIIEIRESMVRGF